MTDLSTRPVTLRQGAIDSFSIAGLDVRGKCGYWNNRASESLVPLVCDIGVVKNVHGSIVREKISVQYVAEVFADTLIVRHTPSHVSRMHKETIQQVMPLEGECLERHHRRDLPLEAGQFALLDGTHPFETVKKVLSRVLVIGQQRERTASQPFEARNSGHGFPHEFRPAPIKPLIKWRSLRDCSALRASSLAWESSGPPSPGAPASNPPGRSGCRTRVPALRGAVHIN